MNVLQAHPDKRLSRAATQIMCDLVSDVQQRLCREAKMLLRSSRGKTLTSLTIETAVRLLFPGELSRHAVVEGKKCIEKYLDSKK